MTASCSAARWRTRSAHHAPIGTPTHSRLGVDVCVWSTGYLRRGRPSTGCFEEGKGSELRRRLMARTLAPALPESVVTTALRLE